MDIHLLNRKQLSGVIQVHWGDPTLMIENLKSSDVQEFVSINLTRSREFDAYPLAHQAVYDKFFKGSDEGSLASDRYVQYSLTKQAPRTLDENILIKSSATVKSRLRRLQEGTKHYISEADDSKYSELSEECPVSVKSLIDDILASGDTVSRVRLAGIAPGHTLGLHRDHDPSKLIRLHVPIKTNEQCMIECENKSGEIIKAHLAVGNLYILNTGRRHSVSNNSEEWRVHLLIDIRGQNFLKKVNTSVIID